VAQREQVLETVSLLGEDDRDRISASSNAPWLLRGAARRAARPKAARSATLTQGRGVHVVEGRFPRVQAASSSSGVGIAGFVALRRPFALDRDVVMASTLAGVANDTCGTHSQDAPATSSARRAWARWIRSCPAASRNVMS